MGGKIKNKAKATNMAHPKSTTMSLMMGLARLTPRAWRAVQMGSA
jgi:hypothetical protein